MRATELRRAFTDFGVGFDGEGAFVDVFRGENTDGLGRDAGVDQAVDGDGGLLRLFVNGGH